MPSSITARSTTTGSLIAELTALGHTFRTRSDTEVIVHAWEEWGKRCVERFRGMFAFALWDRNRSTLFLARDRLGVKPLHYALLADGTFLFGSELKALLAHGELPREIDPCAVEEYFALGYVPEPRTIFRDAKKLPPAHTLTLRRGAPIPEPVEYWDPRFTLDRQLTLGDATTELLDRLEESVRLRMIAEVPLGHFSRAGSTRVQSWPRWPKSPPTPSTPARSPLPIPSTTNRATRCRSPNATGRGISSTGSKVTILISSMNSRDFMTNLSRTAPQSRLTVCASLHADM